eukprot:CAMPEP_0113246294 /NCGR_PEP_ID=MMETSP0008_2-20120614/9391_1 /TAXON_ID=97485 /ORGANISM="Prymnesium parvum" /LENGTH=133 /DNA_ID=CAMNT_0000094035 /DNA_START=392 /DNA_END=791 /DNA_ORIENTATION=- /assembly_acc=CAM_ASM_000153
MEAYTKRNRLATQRRESPLEADEDGLQHRQEEENDPPRHMPRDVQPALRAARQHLGGARAEQHAHREHHRGDREEDQPDHQVPRDGEPRAERAERDRRREQRLERRRAAAPLRPRQLALAVHERRGGEVARRG